MCSSKRYKRIIVADAPERQHEIAMGDPVLPYESFLEGLHENEVDALKANPVLVVCDDAECSDRMLEAVRKRGMDAICCASMADARALLSQQCFSLVFCSESLPDGDGRSLTGVAGAVPVIVLLRGAESDAYFHALGHEAFDYVACRSSDLTATELRLKLPDELRERES